MGDDKPPRGDGRATAWTIGILAVAAWLVLLWQMFGEVL
jgi:hypothetical protein